MTNISLPPEMEKYAAALRAEKERLNAEKEKIDGEIAVVDQLISTMENFSGDFTKWREANSTESKGIHSHISERDIRKCRTQQTALEEIARLSGGIANATEAGKLIHKTKLTNGKVGSVVSGVHRIMSDKDQWEWISPGTFRRLTPLSEKSGDSQPEAAAEVSPEPSSEAPAEPSSEAPPRINVGGTPEKVGDADEVNSALIGQTDPEEEIVPPTELNS